VNFGNVSLCEAMACLYLWLDVDSEDGRNIFKREGITAMSLITLVEKRR